MRWGEKKTGNEKRITRVQEGGKENQRAKEELRREGKCPLVARGSKRREARRKGSQRAWVLLHSHQAPLMPKPARSMWFVCFGGWGVTSILMKMEGHLSIENVVAFNKCRLTQLVSRDIVF